MSIGKKNSILASATKVFAKEGYDNASVDEIALQANVAKGTFYYHFKSKEDLFISLISTGTDKLSEQMSEAADKYSNPIDKVGIIVESQYKFFSENNDLCRVLLSEIWRFESKWKQKYEPKRDKYIYAMEQTIIQGQHNNVFDKDINPKLASIAIFGLTATSALDQIVIGEKITTKTIEMIKKLAINSLLSA
ncbi:MAG: TetR/AcrR family transcriptional regulator [Ignavibacteria bacterium]|nr:TetR/AcrR family transcriptional regulator [Ignavibacteria bacterium]